MPSLLRGHQVIKESIILTEKSRRGSVQEIRDGRIVARIRFSWHVHHKLFQLVKLIILKIKTRSRLRPFSRLLQDVACRLNWRQCKIWINTGHPKSGLIWIPSILLQSLREHSYRWFLIRSCVNLRLGTPNEYTVNNWRE